ncbi:PTS sugar transporter subunit IIA [Gorillibacterium massiliense]|uniref:PTS sugar transporter subunit IIA n=1 Tax=Gorillibacterium massiliense TaxID=1280390 RepID=UPI0004BAC311|nr:PTS glucose transporter subunit IIA [Gorillibacterium massiliense]
MANWFSKKTKSKTVEIAAPLSGVSVPLTEVPDEAFAGKHMGDGVAIQPSEGVLSAPFDGIVAHLIDTHHAVIVEHATGLQLLLHIGINTVGLRGKGFHALVKTGDKIKAGQPLIEFDQAVLMEAGYPTITPVVIANQEIVEKIECRFEPVKRGEERLITAALQA